MRTFKRSVPILIALSEIAICSAQNLCTNIPPGTIVDFNPPISAYRLHRSQQGKSFGMYISLEPDDRLEILSVRSYVEVEDEAGNTTRHKISDSPLCVIAGPRDSPWASAALDALNQKYMRAEDGSPHSLSSRGPSAQLSLDMYSLRAGTATVGKGPRTFALSWTGGVAPFHVTVTSSSQQVLLDESMISQHLLVKRGPVQLTAEAYQVSLTDAKDTLVTGSFTAGTPVFNERNALAEDDHSRVETVAEILAAHPERVFDAYLWLSPEVNRPAIKRLMDALAEGDVSRNLVLEH